MGTISTVGKGYAHVAKLLAIGSSSSSSSSSSSGSGSGSGGGAGDSGRLAMMLERHCL